MDFGETPFCIDWPLLLTGSEGSLMPSVFDMAVDCDAVSPSPLETIP